MKKKIIPKKEEIIEFYIAQHHTKDETCKHFDVSSSTLSRWLRSYDIAKTQDEMNTTKRSKYQDHELLEQSNKKRKLTNLKKYGYENVTQIPEIQQKIKNTCVEKYGCEHAATNSVVKEKIKKTCLEKYGVDNVFKSKEIKTKIHDTMLNKYNTSQIQEKTISTNLKRYGVPYASQSPEVREKIRITCLNKYGADNVSQNQEIKDKKVQTSKNKFGTDYPLQNSDIQNKIKNTCLNKYGVDNVFRLKEFQDKAKETIQKKYGLSSYNQFHINHLDIWLSKDDFVEFLSNYGKKPTVRDLMKEFNVSDVAIGLKAREYQVCDLIDFKPVRSSYEDEVIEFLNSLGFKNIDVNNRSVLDGQEIDIYLPEQNFGIEFNGDYWHCDIFHEDHSGRSTYHQNKSLLAEEKGIFLFHIFEYEWNNSLLQSQIKSRLKTILLQNQNKIFARKCIIKEISKEEKKKFLNENHTQGNDHSTKQYGLFYRNELVSCMTFVHPKNDKYTWELSRFCNKHNTTVCGGASKLFKYFLKTLKYGDTISSYNDITKTKGDLYKILGFECKSINSPNYVWINFTTGDIRTRYQEQLSGENQRMHNAGYHKLCDCGTKTWVYTKYYN